MRYKGLITFLCLGVMLTLPCSSVGQTRDPGRVYRVAILPFVIHSQENLDYLQEGMNDVLSSRLTADGRIVVVERSQVERALYEIRPVRLDEEVARRIGSRVEADYIVLGSLTKIGNYISLDARLISITEDKPPLGVYTQAKGVDDVMAKISDFAEEMGGKILGRRPQAARPGGPGASYAPSSGKGILRVDTGSLGYKKSQTFGFEIKGLDVGDVDGDGKNEVVAMDARSIYVFKYDGEKLVLFRKIEEKSSHNFLTLDVADINRNGHAEIIVTSVVEDNLQSFIIEYEDRQFRRISRHAAWYYRALKHPKEGLILAGQQMGPDGNPTGSVYRMIWKKNSYEVGPKIPLPRETSLLGLALVDFGGDGKIDVVTYDKQDRLNIVAGDGRTLWRSGDHFGGTNNSYDTYKKLEEPYSPRDHIATRVYIPPRILVRDLDRDGVPEVIVNRNDFATGAFFEKVRIYEKGEIQSLVREERGLTTLWKTKEIKGYIADFQVADVENSGEEELVVAVVAAEQDTGGYFSKQSRSNIFFFKLF